MKIEQDALVLDSQANTIIFNEKIDKQEGNLNYIKINFNQDIITVLLKQLYLNNIQSVIVEGGALTLQHFIDANLWDEARILRGVPNFKIGIEAPRLQATINEQFTFGKDTVTIFSND